MSDTSTSSGGHLRVAWWALLNFFESVTARSIVRISIVFGFIGLLCLGLSVCCTVLHSSFVVLAALCGVIVFAVWASEWIEGGSY